MHEQEYYDAKIAREEAHEDACQQREADQCQQDQWMQMFMMGMTGMVNCFGPQRQQPPPSIPTH